MEYHTFRAELKKRDLTVHAIARRADITPQSLYGALNGHNAFWPGWKKRIAEALDLDVADLFPEDDGHED